MQLKSILPQSYSISLRSGNWVRMLQWIWCRERMSGATPVASSEVKVASLWLRDGGGWQECIEMGGASTGGITNVNLKRTPRKLETVSLQRGFSVGKQVSTCHLPVCDVTELLQPVLYAMDAFFYSCTLKPMVVFVWPLCVQAAALA